MTVHQLQLILDYLWQRFGFRGDQYGLMFRLADMLAEIEAEINTKRVPQTWDFVKQNSNKNKKICHSARTD